MANTCRIPASAWCADCSCGARIGIGQRENNQTPPHGPATRSVSPPRSPAYDLLPVRLLVDDPEEFALPINGKKNRLERRDFEALGKHLGIPDIVIERTLDGVPARLRVALEQLPSPWVARQQAHALRTLIARNAARLAQGRKTRPPGPLAKKRPAKRPSRPRR
jgi:hypothetical protein